MIPVAGMKAPEMALAIANRMEERMTNIEAARHVMEHGCVLMRAREDDPHQFDVKDIGVRGNKRGWFYLDTQTAHLLVTIYNVLRPENQIIFERTPILRLVEWCWKKVSA